MICVPVEVEKNSRNVTVRSRNFDFVKYVASLSLLLCVFQGVSAQDGKVVVHGSELIDQRIESLIADVDTSELEGYRIQLFFGTDMNNAEEVKAKFASLYPGWSSQIYMPYTQPYWRVRIGNFYSQLEAQPMLKQLASDFGNVFLVKDKIVRPPLVSPRY